ncbi:Putative RxLR effector [Phytophthora palmivora]|uniref:RxLR effector protein n=1 Tax=Phytophthora palmivora TaxID=4796 RepID=A0A2P4XN05_9STRA|nr:Putative RxLR effector [Phytophthora palmivora]
MQLHYFVLLAAAIAFYGVDALASTNSKPTQAISLAVEEEDVLVKRLLRSHDEEERGTFTMWFKGLFKSDGYTKLSKKLSSGEKEKLAKQLSLKSKSNVISTFDDLPPQFQKIKGQTADEAFSGLGLKNVDDFFSNKQVSKISVENAENIFKSKQFAEWNGYIAHLNRYNDKVSVAKFMRGELGDNKAARLFASAISSSDENVKKMGIKFEKDLLKQWTKTNMKTPKEVAAISKSLVEKYTQVYNRVIAKRKADIKWFLQGRVAENAANAATRV